MAKKRTQDQINNDILAALDLVDEYERMGVVFAQDVPRASGKISCYSRQRGPDSDKSPSAFVDTSNGRYFDSSTGESHSLWDFAAKYSSAPAFTDWKDARKHFADKAGVKIGRLNSDDDMSPLDRLHFLPWTAGYERLAKIWGGIHKKPISLDAIKSAGGLLARFPCYYDRDDKGRPVGEKKMGRYTVVAVPCFMPGDYEQPKAWIVWNVSGGVLEIYRGREVPPEPVKMWSVGPTAGLMMGKHGLRLLQSAQDRAPFDFVFKTAGPTDMLALFTAMPVEDRLQFPVVTNASTETGLVSPQMAAVFTGQRLAVVHDADDAGVEGVRRWMKALKATAAERVWVQLPYPVERKHGKDLRHYFTEQTEVQG